MSYLFLLIALVSGVRAIVELVDDWSSAAATASLALTMASCAMAVALHTRRQPKPLVLTPAAPRRPRCQVHDSTPTQLDWIYRHSTVIICTCHPLPTTATPPPPKREQA